MSIVITSDQPLESNECLFKNDAIGEEDLGDISWDEPFEDGSTWKVTLSGVDVEGTTIPETTINIDESETISPQKVFLWIANKIKTTLCPNCV